MMNFIRESNIFLQSQLKIDNLIMREKRLPKQVFKSPLTQFRIIDFDEIFTHSFFERLKSFLSYMGESCCFMAVVEPDPDDYFFRNFGKYPIIEMSIDDTVDSYIQITQEDPGGSPADAIAFNSTVILLYSNSAKWAIYGDRRFELGIIAFVDKQPLELFTSIFGSDRVFNVNDAIEQLLEVVYSNSDSEVSLDTRAELIENYQSRQD